MACSKNHAEIPTGKFCPECGIRIHGVPEFTNSSTEVSEPLYTGGFIDSSADPHTSKVAKGPKLIALVAVAVSTVLLITGIVSNKLGFDQTLRSIDAIVNNNTYTDTTTTDSSWVPAGYTQWTEDPSLAFQFNNSASCQSDYGNGCFMLDVVTSGTCSSVYGDMDLTDSNGAYVNSTSASGGALYSGDTMTLEFDDPDGSATHAKITSLVCG
jgi:hypothetical protein